VHLSSVTGAHTMGGINVGDFLCRVCFPHVLTRFGVVRNRSQKHAIINNNLHWSITVPDGRDRSSERISCSSLTLRLTGESPSYHVIRSRLLTGHVSNEAWVCFFSLKMDEFGNGTGSERYFHKQIGTK